MKLILTSIGAVAVIAVLAVFFGDRLISNRHTVGQFTLAVPQTEDPVAGSLVYGGLQTALENCGMDASEWDIVPSSRWQKSDSLARTNTNSVLIILSNRVDGAKLYTRVSFVSSNALEFNLYRPK